MDRGGGGGGGGGGACGDSRMGFTDHIFPRGYQLVDYGILLA